MSGYTPGPWKVIPPDEDCDLYFIGRDRLEVPLGQVPEHLDDGRAYYICAFGDFMPQDDAEDNAHLIAAAPDLLQWLKVILDHVDYTSGACSLTEPVGAVLSTYVIKQARAAIARAEGKAE